MKPQNKKRQLNHNCLMSCMFQKTVEKVAHLEFHKASGGTVGTGITIALGHLAVDDEGDLVIRVVDETQHRGGPHTGTQFLEQHLCRGERHSGYAQCTTELFGYKGFLASGHIHIELRLLAVAQQNSLDHGALQAL